jgi:hypothetical protein
MIQNQTVCFFLIIIASFQLSYPLKPTLTIFLPNHIVFYPVSTH